MNKGPVDDRYKEFEDVLEQMPQEQPPEDLKQRCMDALDAAERAAKPAPVKRGRWELAWNVMAAAAAVVLIVSATSTLIMSGREQATHWRTAREHEVAEKLAQGDDDASGPHYRGVQSEGFYRDEALGASEEPEAAAPPPPADEAKAMGQYVAGRRMAETPPGEPAQVDSVSGLGDGASPKQAGGEIVAGVPGKTEPAPVRGGEYRQVPPKPASTAGRALGTDYTKTTPPYAPPPAAGAPAKPWRDESGDRQKITRKEMELAVEDVQKAYDDAASIIERADGYVDSDTLVVEDKGKDHAHISARVPVQELNDVISRLRVLGKVVRLVGETDDVTREYYTQGSDIRDLGAKEVELVERYEREKHKARKRALYQQIMAIRAQNAGRKDNLSALSDQTHYAFLELDLVEKLSPRGFLGDMTEKMAYVGSWAGATAIFWIPLLVLIAYFTRRGGRRRQAEVRTEE